MRYDYIGGFLFINLANWTFSVLLFTAELPLFTLLLEAGVLGLHFELFVYLEIWFGHLSLAALLYLVKVDADDTELFERDERDERDD